MSDKDTVEIQGTVSNSELIERLGAEPLDKEAYIKKMVPLQADTLRFMVADLTEELRRMSGRIMELEEGIRLHLVYHENGCAYLSHLVAPNEN